VEVGIAVAVSTTSGDSIDKGALSSFSPRQLAENNSRARRRIVRTEFTFLREYHKVTECIAQARSR